MARVLSPRLSFVPAEKELEETEIRSRFGPIITEAETAFRSDPHYLVDMAHQASLIAYRRELWEVRTETTRDLGRLCEDTVAARLAERGVSAPRSRGRRRG